MADEEAPKEVKRDPDDILKDWFKARVVSSFKCKPEAAEALVNNETSRVAVETFLNNETSQRLLVFSNPDLTAVRAASRRLSLDALAIVASRRRLPSSSTRSAPIRSRSRHRVFRFRFQTRVPSHPRPRVTFSDAIAPTRDDRRR